MHAHCNRPSIAERLSRYLPAKQGIPSRPPQRASYRGRLVCSAEYIPYPFAKKDYQKCVIRVGSHQQASAVGLVTVGTLIFMQEIDTQVTGAGGLTMDNRFMAKGHALIMGIGGESLECLMRLMERKDSPRPPALELLWAILQRGQEISKKEWKLLHVAIVAMADNAYVARLFFGDAETGDIVWDVDCRPSDASWLALKSKCPIYMHKDVWTQCSRPWRDLVPRDAAAEPVGNEDPEPVKRLKREMEVALSEEDFATAVRIRDHPFMILARRIDENEREGRKLAAAQLKAELDHLIIQSSTATWEGPQDDQSANP